MRPNLARHQLLALASARHCPLAPALQVTASTRSRWAGFAGALRRIVGFVAQWLERQLVSLYSSQLHPSVRASSQPYPFVLACAVDISPLVGVRCVISEPLCLVVVSRDAGSQVVVDALDAKYVLSLAALTTDVTAASASPLPPPHLYPVGGPPGLYSPNSTAIAMGGPCVSRRS